MELFRDRHYVDAFREAIPESHVFYNFGYYSVNFPSATHLFLESWNQSHEYFKGYEQPLELWEPNSDSSGRCPCQGHSLDLLKPIQVTAPLDLRTKKSFHIETLTSDVTPSSPSSLLVSDPPSNRPVEPPRMPHSCSERQPPVQTGGHIRKDHSIRSFLPFVDRQDSEKGDSSPLNLSTDETRRSSVSCLSLNSRGGASPILQANHFESRVHPPAAGVRIPERLDAEKENYSGDDEDGSDTMPYEASTVVAPGLVATSLITCQQVGCQKTFHSRGALTIHAHRFHSSGTKDVRPRRCQQVQQQHQRRRHSRDKPSGKTLLCSYQGCGKSFRETKHLKVHQMQHTDDRPLACQLCPYNCRQRNSMNWHMKAKHGHEKRVTHDGKTIYLRKEEVIKA